MNKPAMIAFFLLTGKLLSFGQVGVGTTSPNSTLDVRGSLSAKYASFSSATTAGADNLLVFTGTSAATLTLPDATSCQGRYYWIKNTSSNSSTLTIATTSAQTIDGIGTWTLTQTNKAVRVVSNGSNWLVTSEVLPGASAGTPWIYGGNNVTSIQNIGTTSNFHLPFITNNTERMRLTTAGSLGIGASTFNGTYPERLLVDGGSTGNTNYQNVIVGKGNTNSYAQLNIQNNSTGNAASSDVVATANNGNETTNFIDVGINGSGNTSTGVLGGANTAYLYSTGNDFAIGNGSSSKDLLFFTNGGSGNKEAMRITDDGNVGIGTSTFDASNPDRLIVDASSTGSSNVITGVGDANSYLQFNVQNNNNGNFASSDVVATANNGSSSTVYIDMGINSQGYLSGSSSILNGSNAAYLYATGNNFYIGNGASGKDLVFFTNSGATGADGTERMRVTSTGVLPGSNNNYDLGSSTKRWSTIYAQNVLNTSDARLKTNICNLNYGLSAILKMKPVRYSWKDGVSKDTQMGFLAQDLKKVIPEVVAGDETKENLAVNYIELIPVMANAIKEQQQQIEQLKKEIKALKKKR